MTEWTNDHSLYLNFKIGGTLIKALKKDLQFCFFLDFLTSWKSSSSWSRKSESKVSKLTLGFWKISESPVMDRKSLKSLFHHAMKVMVPKPVPNDEYKIFTVWGARFFFNILQPTHFLQKKVFTWAKLFFLKSLNWLKLTVGYLKLFSKF